MQPQTRIIGTVATQAMTRRNVLAGFAATALLPVPALATNASRQVRVELETSNNFGTVSSGMFGVNILAARDALNGTFGERIATLRPTSLRWPGGELSHNLFTENGDIDPALLTGLPEFLQYCRQNRITPVIVIPTEKTRLRTFALYYQAVRRLLLQVNELLRSTPTMVAWEVGNEPYAERDQTADLYARTARIVINEIRRIRPLTDRIGIIAGPPNRNIGEWAQVMARSILRSTYHFIIYHSYPTDYNIYTLSHIAEARRIIWNKPVFVSEWNHYSCWNPDYQFPGGTCESREQFFDATYGISAAGAMVSHFVGLVSAGVTLASFWGVQQNNMNMMFPNEGQSRDTAAFVTGQMFRWLRNTQGMRVFHLERHADETQPAVFGMHNSSHAIFFVDARNSAASHVDINVRQIRCMAYWSHRMSGENDVRTFVPEVNFGRVVINNGTLRVPLNVRSTHEVVRVVMRK